MFDFRPVGSARTSPGLQHIDRAGGTAACSRSASGGRGRRRPPFVASRRERETRMSSDSDGRAQQEVTVRLGRRGDAASAGTTTRSGVPGPTTSPRCSRRCTLGIFPFGLSCSTVSGSATRSGRHPGLRRPRGAATTARGRRPLVQDASIIRNRAKIQATIDIARAMTSASPASPSSQSPMSSPRRGLRALSPTYPRPPRRLGAFAKQLKSRGTASSGRAYTVHAGRRRRQRPPSWMLPHGRLVGTARRMSLAKLDCCAISLSSVPSDRVSLQSRMSFRSAKNQRPSILANVSR